jgi:hypothetical protein
MRLNWTRRLGLAAGMLAVAAALAGPAQAQPIIGLTKSNGFFTFDSATPGTVSATGPVTGLAAGDQLLAIDINPNDGQLYVLGSQSRMYSVDEAGAATQVGPVFTNLLGSTNVDMDFDPQFGAIRITTDGDKNILWFPSGFDQLDTALTWAPAPDPNAGTNPVALGLAYSPNVPGATSRTAFAYQYAPTDIIATLGSVGGSPESASGGVLHTIGPPGVVAQAPSVGLDAGPDGTMFALLRTDPPGADPLATRLYTIDTATGTASLVSGDNATSLVGTGTDTTADIATDTVTNNFQLSASTYPVSESAGTVTVTVNRSQSRGTASVQIASSNGSAESGRDYSAIGGTLFFADGQTSKTIDIPIRSDAVDESAETINVALSSPIGGHAATLAPSSGVVVIEDDDTGPPPSEKITALTTTNELVTFDSSTPGTVSAPLTVTGLVAGEELVAIDRRPATGQLYGMTKQSRLYTIDEVSGAATQVGTGQFSPSLAGSAWGFDFDPVAAAIRVSSNQNAQNLRLNPTTGVSTADSPFVFDAGDPNALSAPSLAAAAYTDNVPGATSTTLFAYDHQKDSLVRVGSPGGAPVQASSGAVVTIGKSGIIASSAANDGMDIGPDGIAWALLRDNGMTRLNIMDLTTGRAALVGEVGAGTDIYRDITLPAVSQAMQLSADSYAGSEAAGSAKVTVTRSQTLGAATVDYATSNGSATAGSDYTAATGTVAFAAGEASKEITIPVTNDAAVEGPETLTLTVSNARGGVASVGSPAAATVTIADDGTITSDTVKPVVTTCHKGKQNIVKQKAVVVCVRSNEAGDADVTGKLMVGGLKKRFALRTVRRTVAKDAKRTFKLKLSKKARAAVKKALRKRRKVTAKVTIRVRDAARNQTRLVRKIRAKAK